MTSKILFLSGSARRNSSNKKLAKAAYNIALEKKINATFIDLKDFPMPIYDGDFEEENGLPETAITLKRIFTEHNAIFIASPEYNSSFSALLKNTLDWISRPHQEKEPKLSAFINKVAAISSASPGGLGGMRGLVPLRMLLSNISMIVIPEQLALSGSTSAFDNNGNMIDEKQRKSLENVVSKLISIAEKN